MKKLLLFSFLTIALLASCTKEPEEKPAVRTPEEMIVGVWTNVADSYLALTESGNRGEMNVDADAITFSFSEDGIVIMDYQETDILFAGTDTSTYQLQGDSLVLGNGTAYAVSLLEENALTLEYRELMNGGQWVYEEHIVFVRKNMSAGNK